jgi:hypothetical protein
MLLIAEGKVDEAWQDLLACHRLGRLIGRGAYLVEFLVSHAIDRVATKGDVAFLGHAKLTSKQVRACLDDLRRLPALPAAADEVVSNERFMLLDTIMQTARHGTAYVEDLTSKERKPPEGNQLRAKLFTRSIDWDPAFRNTNRRYDQYVAALRIADRTERAQELSVITEDVKILGDKAKITTWPEKQFMGPEGRGEVIGNILIRLFMPGFDKFESTAERAELEQRVLHVAFALAAYRYDCGRYPAKLDELAPKYMVKVPDDLFSGEALIYKLEDDGYLLYSVGVDGIDEDGRGHDDQPPGDDLSVRMPVPAPQANR